jgi:hypothetical protein
VASASVLVNDTPKSRGKPLLAEKLMSRIEFRLVQED